MSLFARSFSQSYNISSTQVEVILDENNAVIKADENRVYQFICTVESTSKSATSIYVVVARKGGNGFVNIIDNDNGNNTPQIIFDSADSVFKIKLNTYPNAYRVVVLGQKIL